MVITIGAEGAAAEREAIDEEALHSLVHKAIKK
jgi:hypothetical protein